MPIRDLECQCVETILINNMETSFGKQSDRDLARNHYIHVFFCEF